MVFEKICLKITAPYPHLFQKYDVVDISFIIFVAGPVAHI
jgi:hypothetical protein